MPYSHSQKGEIHFSNQHQTARKRAAEKIVAVRQNTTLKMFLEIYPEIYI